MYADTNGWHVEILTSRKAKQLSQPGNTYKAGANEFTVFTNLVLSQTSSSSCQNFNG